MNILNLPNVVLIQIFELLPYEEVSKKRLICKKLDMICQHILNCGFNKVVKQHSLSLKRIKALLPRRESERRTHCLARHADILTCLETRISMLSMTYSKYMDLNLCCFIPGRVLDEIFRILRLISKTSKPLRPHEVLQELRDISSMAIEHFDEKISHLLKKSFTDGNSMYSSSSSSTTVSSSILSVSSSSKSICCDQMRQKVNILLGIHQTSFEPATFSVQVPPKTPQIETASEPTATSSSSSSSSSSSRTFNEGSSQDVRTVMMNIKKIKQACLKAVAKMNRMQHVQALHARSLNESFATTSALSAQVVELKKRLEDMDAKNRDLTASIKQLKGESTAQSTTPPSTATTPQQDTTATANALPLAVDDNDDVDIKPTAAVKRHLQDDEQPPEVASISCPSISSAKKTKVE